jgi:hypothetical protein
MLIRLLPEQVSEAWDVIAPAVAESLPTTVVHSYTAVVNVLEAILAEKAVAWLYYKEGRPACFILTTPYRDPIVHTVNLLIYSMFSFEDLDEDDWQHGLDRLKQYAKFIGAEKVMAYTNQPGVIRLVSKLGADTSYTLIEV